MNKIRLKEFWSEILLEIRKKINEQTYQTWFSKTYPIELKENTLVIMTSTKFFADWLEQHYKILLEEIAYKIVQEKICIRFDSEDKEVKRVSQSFNKSGRLKGYELKLNARYTFDSFVVGNSNRFAHSAAMAVARNQGRVYNPLFIYGDTGLGKTHLMQAIGHYLYNKKNVHVFYTSAEDFTNEMIFAIQKNKMTKFRTKYRNFDALLIDDIQFLSKKEGSQEEFFHTFNTLYNSKKQIVITCDRAPKSITDLQDRLISRFECGLLTDLQPPEYETRVAILKKKIEDEKMLSPEKKVNLKQEVINFIAENFYTNVRELEGSYIRILAYSSSNMIDPESLDVEQVKQILKDMMMKKKKLISLELIHEEVANFYGLRKRQLIQDTRKHEVVFPRQIAMYFSEYLLSISQKEIAKYYHRKDHSTVIYAKKMVKKKMAEDKEFKNELEELRKYIEN
ncbi:MAG: chromosomal replication initiator protein DnaA [Candidatus Cloacimonadota bacterium]|nr:MAG: chromosomal replication initiator protein DnaA [Candidatus Cloacimonadota bacterium]